MTYEFACATCGCPSTAVRRNARHCHPCGVLKVLSYLRTRYKRARKCGMCEARFRPASQGDLGLCHPCDTVARPDAYTRLRADLCVFCGGAVYVGSLHRKICTGCMKNPIRQDEIAALLTKQQLDRRSQYLRKDA